MIHPLKLSLRPQVINVHTLRHCIQCLIWPVKFTIPTHNRQQAYLVYHRGLPSAFVAGVTKQLFVRKRENRDGLYPAHIILLWRWFSLANIFYRNKGRWSLHLLCFAIWCYTPIVEKNMDLIQSIIFWTKIALYSKK